MKEDAKMSTIATDEKIKEAVRDTYGGIARRFVGSSERASCCGPTRSASCCGPTEAATETASVTSRFYSTEELAGLPDTVTDASLGCGNPIAISELQPGETVLDLGSGGGIDCLLAARQVGPQGKVIGLDMTPDMIKLARRNAKKVGAANVDFRYGEMENIPLPDASVDVVISNCVINLSPDKDAVFREAHRVLRPGGRMNVSDVVLQGELPQAVRDKLDAWAGCVAGALEESDYLDKIRAAGFEEVEVLSRDYATAEQVAESEEVQILAVRRDGQEVEGKEAQALLAEAGISAAEIAPKVASIKVRARKPV
jgi:arsenite methyltransferase